MNAAKIEKTDTKNLLKFWKMELTPSLIAIGAFSTILATALGVFLRLASFEIVASFGVICKIALQDISVASSANTNRNRQAAADDYGLIVCGIIGIE